MQPAQPWVQLCCSLRLARPHAKPESYLLCRHYMTTALSQKLQQSLSKRCTHMSSASGGFTSIVRSSFFWILGSLKACERVGRGT